MEKILQKLGFKRIGIVEKTRDSWYKGNLGFQIDHVNNLGTFIEVEYLFDDSTTTIDLIKQKLKEIISEIFPTWSGNEERRSYLELLLISTNNREADLS